MIARSQGRTRASVVFRVTRCPPPRARADACPGVFAPHDAADGALARVRCPAGAHRGGSCACRRGLRRGAGRRHLRADLPGNLQLRGLPRSGRARRAAGRGRAAAVGDARAGAQRAGVAAVGHRAAGWPTSGRSRGAGPGPVRPPGAGGAARPVPVRPRRRPGRRRRGGPGPVLAARPARLLVAGVARATVPAAAPWPCCWTRPRRSWRCGRRTAARPGGWRS